VLAKCSPESPVVTHKLAVLSSFDRSAVIVSDVQGVFYPGTKAVHEVAARVTNGGKARIYDFYLYCRFRLRRSGSGSEDSASQETSRISSSYHYGYIHPGATIAVSLGVNGDGYLSLADPQSFDCEPRYEVETSDLLRTKVP
jgi:hypothetical protein